MLNDLLTWGALLVGLAFLVVDNRRGYGALTMAYFLDLSLGHVPGILAYLDPNMYGSILLCDIMLNDLLIWGALLVGLTFLVVDKRRGDGALTLAYFLDLSLGHVPGVLAYLDPNIISVQRRSDEDRLRCDPDRHVGFHRGCDGCPHIAAANHERESVSTNGQPPDFLAARLAYAHDGDRLLLCGFAGFGALAVIDGRHIGYGGASHSWLMVLALFGGDREKQPTDFVGFRDAAVASAGHASDRRLHRLRHGLGLEHRSVLLRHRAAPCLVLSRHPTCYFPGPFAVRDLCPAA